MPSLRTKRSLPLRGLGLLIAFSPSFAWAQSSFVFDLRGDEEVPVMSSAASGGCLAVFDGVDELALTCVHDVSGATLMHVHRAPAGANGPIAFDFGTPTSPVTATWVAMTPADVADLLAGNLYVNIHTGGRPAGAIRGQIEDQPDLSGPLAFTADGSAAVPPDPTLATASCSADLDSATMTLQVGCTHDLVPAEAAHLHQGPFGSNGPLVHDFASAASGFSATIAMTPLLVASFAATFLYLEIHDLPVVEGDPATTLRGQLGTPPLAATTGSLEVTKRTVPGGGGGFDFTANLPGGPASFSLADGGQQGFLGVAPGSYVVAESDPGPGHALVAISCDDHGSQVDPYSGGAGIQLAAAEKVRCTFFNVGTAADQLFVFHLAGAQEVPPVPSAARGGCAGLFVAAASRLTLVCLHDVAQAVLMHVHRGEAGVNGPIVFDLGAPLSPVMVTWNGMTPAEVADLLAGRLYVNIHTAGRPSGEIRGQIVSRSLAGFPFVLSGAQMVPANVTPIQGSCFASLAQDAAILGISCTHGLVQATAAHLHEGVPGSVGPRLFTFADPASPLAADVPMNPRALAAWAAGFLYLDVHGAPVGDPQDEIRGQLSPAALSAANVPTLGGVAAVLLAAVLAALAWWRLRG